MSIRLECACGKRLVVKAQLAGRRVKCPSCQAIVSVPRVSVERPSADEEWNWQEASDATPVPHSRSAPSAPQRGSVSRRTPSSPQGTRQAPSRRGWWVSGAVAVGLLGIAGLAWLLWSFRPTRDVTLTTTGTSAPQSPSVGNAAPMVPSPTVGQVEPSVPARPSGEAPGSTAQNDLERLQGTWQPIEIAVDADPPPPAKALEAMKQQNLTFRDDILAIPGPAGGADMLYTVRLDPAQSPRRLELRSLDGNGSNLAGPKLAIYALEGEILRLCLAKGNEYPSAMKPDRDRGPVVLTLQKVAATPAVTELNGVSGDQFDLSAWRQASAQLAALKVPAVLYRREANDPYLPDGVSHCAVIDPTLAPDGSISAEAWKVILTISHVAIRTTLTTDVTLKQLATHPGLVGLTANGKWEVTPGGITLLHKGRQLRSLNLNGIAVSAPELNAITQSESLRSLALNDTPVSTEMMATVSQLMKLRSLGLRNTGITDEAVLEIAKLASLQSLAIDGSRVTDQGLRSLQKLAGLTSFEIRGLNLSPAALAEFEAALPKCKIFK